MTRLSEMLRTLREYLLPHEAERDASFQREIRRLSRRGLYFMGVVMLVMGVLIYPSITALFPEMFVPTSAYSGFFVLIASFLALARSRLGLRFARPVGLLGTYALLLAAFWFDLNFARDAALAEKFVLADSLGVLLMAVVLIPALPIQTFLLAVASAVSFVVTFRFSPWWQGPGSEGWYFVALTLFFFAFLPCSFFR